MQIIRVEEKHSTDYYDASTPEQWARSALAILTMRHESGWYYHSPEEVYPEHPYNAEEVLTQEQIDGLPTEALRKQEQDKLSNLKRRERDKRFYTEWYNAMAACVEAQDTSLVVVGKGRFERQEPRAWRLLSERSDHEYERVILEDVEQP